jgi:hypothetical protein
MFKDPCSFKAHNWSHFSPLLTLIFAIISSLRSVLAHCLAQVLQPIVVKGLFSVIVTAINSCHCHQQLQRVSGPYLQPPL